MRHLSCPTDYQFFVHKLLPWTHPQFLFVCCSYSEQTFREIVVEALYAPIRRLLKLEFQVLVVCVDQDGVVVVVMFWYLCTLGSGFLSTTGFMSEKNVACGPTCRLNPPATSAFDMFLFRFLAHAMWWSSAEKLSGGLHIVICCGSIRGFAE